MTNAEKVFYQNNFRADLILGRAARHLQQQFSTYMPPDVARSHFAARVILQNARMTVLREGEEFFAAQEGEEFHG